MTTLLFFTWHTTCQYICLVTCEADTDDNTLKHIRIIVVYQIYLLRRSFCAHTSWRRAIDFFRNFINDFSFFFDAHARTFSFIFPHVREVAPRPFVSRCKSNQTRVVRPRSPSRDGHQVAGFFGEKRRNFFYYQKYTRKNSRRKTALK